LVSSKCVMCANSDLISLNVSPQHWHTCRPVLGSKIFTAPDDCTQCSVCIWSVNQDFFEKRSLHSTQSLNVRCSSTWLLHSLFVLNFSLQVGHSKMSTYEWSSKCSFSLSSCKNHLLQMEQLCCKNTVSAHFGTSSSISLHFKIVERAGLEFLLIFWVFFNFFIFFSILLRFFFEWLASSSSSELMCVLLVLECRCNSRIDLNDTLQTRQICFLSMVYRWALFSGVSNFILSSMINQLRKTFSASNADDKQSEKIWDQLIKTQIIKITKSIES